VALLGANGAGKTTLLRILATLARPTAGHLTIGGLPLPEQAGAVRRHLGYVGHQTFLYDELTIRENLTFYGRLYRVAALPDRITAVLGQVGLAERADDRVRALSRGLQQRASLTRAILHDPPILLLDEPDTGLDVSADHVLRSLFADDRGRPRTVILTTHNLERALALTDRVVVLDRGRIVLDRPSATVNVAQVAGAIRGETRLR
jgi:heme exporter protein A